MIMHIKKDTGSPPQSVGGSKELRHKALADQKSSATKRWRIKRAPPQSVGGSKETRVRGEDKKEYCENS